MSLTVHYLQAYIYIYLTICLSFNVSFEKEESRKLIFQGNI